MHIGPGHVLKSASNGKEHYLLNKRGEKKIFKKFESVIKFVQEYCPSKQKLKIFLNENDVDGIS